MTSICGCGASDPLRPTRPEALTFWAIQLLCLTLFFFPNEMMMTMCLKTGLCFPDSCYILQCIDSQLWHISTKAKEHKLSLFQWSLPSAKQGQTHPVSFSVKDLRKQLRIIDCHYVSLFIWVHAFILWHLTSLVGGDGDSGVLPHLGCQRWHTVLRFNLKCVVSVS